VADVLSPEQRRFNMSRIRGRDTKPEMVVRRLVHSLGFRYRLHVRSVPGSPDLVFPGSRKVVFVHGCFWHRHTCRYGRPAPRTRAAFWRKKLLRNVERDREARRALRKEGWTPLVIWQCQTKVTDLLRQRILRFLCR
jgi:DNA mismatch endonuclease (patch repair protein)